ncbi:MAG: hypothetical protein L6R39_006502 [Caloplaca ligustica]|nr:MAG: hypothetical protein L6R39_006502 [Caloplaca ligustica]
MYLVLWIGFLSAFSSAAAIEANTVAGPSLLQNVDTSNTTHFNGGLAFPSFPWGPDDFNIQTVHLHAPLPRDECYMHAIRLLGNQAQEDFNGRLPEARLKFRDRQYPNVLVVVASAEPNQPLLRKHLFWGIARIMHHFRANNRYLASAFALTWQGQQVGEVLFVPGGWGSRKARLGSGYTELSLSDFAANTPGHKEISARDDLPEMDFSYYGVNLGMDNVFMGTIGALIQAGEHPDQNFNQFVGAFLGYNAFIGWVRVQPSGIPKRLLVRLMARTASEAMYRRDFHEVKVSVKANGRHIAQGGYISAPSQSLRNGSAVANS